jgi:signal transduction histidine kinase/DNA-binding response OmpR family regulator
LSSSEATPEISRGFVSKPKAGWLFVMGLFALLLVAGVWTFTFRQIAFERAEMRREVTDHLGNIAVTLTHNISRTSGELDMLLKFMRAMRKSQPASVPWQEIVTEDYTLNRHTVQIAIIAKDGMMVTSTKMLYPPKPVDLSDRDHYRVHLNAAVDQLFISKPVLGRASGKWSVQYTRPLFDESGKFDGVIVVSLDPDRFTRIYDHLDLGANGGVVIVGDDGIIRAGTGEYAAKLGERFVDGTNYSNLRPDAANFTAGLEHDGKTMKIVARQPVEGYPLRVIVIADDVSGAGWLLKVQAYLLGTILFTVLTTYAAWSAIWHHVREDALVQEQNRVLVEKEVAEAASRTKGEFLAIMSHEIRTPLNGVLGALDLIKPEPLSSGARRHLDIAMSSGEYLLALIDDILAFSKLEEGKFVFEESAQSLRSTFADLQELFRPLTEKAGNELIFEISQDVPANVLCDGVRIRQVLLNFLSNANKFTNNGKIAVSCSVLRQDTERAVLHFSVADTGLGIPEDKQKIIFEKFQSLDSSYSRRTDGTGLGLAICDKIIRGMGGEIRLESEYGKGSCFSFDLDLKFAPEQAADCDLDAAEGSYSSRRLRILLAEDNHTNAYITTQYLVTQGHDVVHAENGKAALEQAAAKDFDLILMDISMPEMDGIVAARAIRDGLGRNRETPIIALTAHAVAGTQEKVESSGMNAYLTKPIRRAALLAAVRSFAAPASATIATAATTPENIIDFDELDECFGGAQLKHSLPLISIFIEEMEKKRAALREAVFDKDTRAVARLAHSIFGGASTIGAARLATLCKHLECEAEGSEALDWDDAETTLGALNDTIQEFSALASAHRAKPQHDLAESA